MGRSHAAGPFVLALVILLAGCGGGGAGQGTSRGSADRIVESELVGMHQLSGYEAIQRLRPRWLVTRTHVLPQVHLNGTISMGGMDALRTMRAADVIEMRFLNAADATTRFGTNYLSGVILVTTRGG